MQRIAPKPAMITAKRIRHFFPFSLTERVTPLSGLFGTTSIGIPAVSTDDWKLEITGLVNSPRTLSFADLERRPKRILESVFVCSGNPARPTVPMRRAGNVKWGGVDLAALLAELGVKSAATHVWSYGLDYGNFHGTEQQHYLKDFPLSRLDQRDVLIAYELNGEPLSQENGFPARLVIPGYYGTNCVKWLCRLELADRRADSIMTTKFYNDPDFDADPSGAVVKPVWAVAPESLIVSVEPESTVKRGTVEIWGWAWSSCEVRSVDVSTDGGESWQKATLEPRSGYAWQRFSYRWSPPRCGPYDLQCRATDVSSRSQPNDGARNAVHSVTVCVED
jgi:sulfane dehydrogenase subunit SoxC